MAGADNADAPLSQSANGGAGAAAADSYDYDAFISYRRKDAIALARWMRSKLQRVKLPADVLAAVSEDNKALHARRPRIWLDQIYEKASDDFLLKKVFPALDRSARLIVISTPSVFEVISGKDGSEQPNWVVREIDRFLEISSVTGRTRPVDIVLGPKGAEDRFPGRLAQQMRWDFIDLRAFSRWRVWSLADDLDAGLSKLVAALYNIPETALPALRREERRRRRRIFGTIIAVAVCVAMAIGGLALQLHATLGRVQQAMAVSLWNRLDFLGNSENTDELNALWELRLTEAGVKEAFIAELSGNPKRAAQLGRRPEPILRSLSLVWPQEQRQSVLDSLLAAVVETNDPSAIHALAAFLKAAPTELTADQAQALIPLLPENAKDPQTLRTLAEIIGKTPTRLARDQAERTIASVVAAVSEGELGSERVQLFIDAMPPSTALMTDEQVPMATRTIVESIARDAGDPEQLEVLTSLGQALSNRLGKSPEQAQAVMASLLSSIAETEGDPYRLLSLSSLVRALAPAIKPESAPGAFQLILEKIAAGSDAPEAFAALGGAGQEIGDRLAREQAEPLFGPAVDAMDRAASPEQVKATAQLLRTFAGKLAGEEYRTALRSTLGAVGRNSTSGEFDVLIGAMQPLPEEISAADAELAFEPVLAAVIKWEGYGASLIAALQVLSGRLPPERSEALVPIVWALVSGNDEQYLNLAAATMRSLSAQLTADQAQHALEVVLAAIAERGSSNNLSDFVGSGQAIIESVRPGQEQAVLRSTIDASTQMVRSEALTAIKPLIEALTHRLPPAEAESLLLATYQEIIETSDPRVLWARVVRRQALSDQIDGDQLSAIVEHIVQCATATHQPDELQALASAIRLLPAKLTSDEVDQLFGSIAAGIAEAPESEAFDQLETFAGTAALLTDRLSASAGNAATVIMGRLADEAEPQTPFDWERKRALAQVLHALSAPLSSDQERTIMAWLQGKLTNVADPHQLDILVDIGILLQLPLPEGQRQTMVNRSLSMLGWSLDDANADARRILIKLLQQESAEKGVPILVDALKYPGSTGATGDALLGAAAASISPSQNSAASFDERLQAIETWSATAGRRIDLEAAPHCPSPHRTALTCPASDV